MIEMVVLLGVKTLIIFPESFSKKRHQNHATFKTCFCTWKNIQIPNSKLCQENSFDEMLQLYKEPMQHNNTFRDK